LKDGHACPVNSIAKRDLCTTHCDFHPLIINLPREKLGGHPILFLSGEKVRKNKSFKNNRFQIAAYPDNTSPLKSLRGLFNLCFDDSLALDEL
jgi:hypothetical protein